MDVQSELLGTLDNLYASVLDDAAWGESLSRMTRLVNGGGAFLLTSDPRTSVVVQSDTYNLDPVVNNTFMGYYASKDIRIPGALGRPVGDLVVDRSVVTYRELRRSEIYNDFLLPFDVPYLMALWLRKSPEAFVALSLQAGYRRGPFTDEEIDRFKRVIPHLMRVMEVRKLLQQARVNEVVSQALLDRLPFGVFLLNGRAEITASTGPADELLREGTALRYLRQRLRAVHGDDDQKLYAAIQSVVRARRGEEVGVNIAVRRPFGALPLTLVVLPVKTPDLLEDSHLPTCMVLVIDPDRKVHVQVRIIQQALDLTPAESRLALALFHGMSLHQASTRLGRSYNTCKTQMKAIYLKTGCSSHAELVKKIMLTGFASLADRDRTRAKS